MIKEEIELKESLIEVRKNNYILEENKYFIYALKMMHYIGTVDSYLRDDLIYETFNRWILRGRFNHKELKELLDISLDENHLFYRLDYDDKDAVFTRAFSALLIALIINKHRKEKYLDKNDLHRVNSKVLDYFINEKDLRGYVEIKGWAHAVAHIADALDELAQCEGLSKIDLLEMLNVIIDKVCIGNYVFIDEESERLTNVIESILKRNVLKNSEMIAWIKKFKEKINEEDYICKLHLKVNLKGFLRSLYFRITEKEDLLEINKEINKEIKKILKEIE
ncbi:DUF2785 domain-containing protein [Clostridium paridis]|uniref:DUF2785 domain-containing protein n=1 Tax=Clostridium paridis TaxID=2803863 RepID=A0A937FEE2_9CLOT|nr:DUF2785 domain-containing protein [Clostridium paridis]MBL4931673.1 DUF2785 domain-containing protein [Clostridium paridis]